MAKGKITGKKSPAVDAYLAALPPEQRKALAKLRRDIHAAAPLANECISYQIPAFRMKRMLVGFAASSKHCSFFPMSSTTVKTHAEELKNFDTSTATIRFSPEKPLTAKLVGKLVRARLKENALLDKGLMKKGKRKASP